MPDFRNIGRPKKVRWFIVTQWNIDCDYRELMKEGHIRWLAYGAEKCPKTGKDHHQLFMYLRGNVCWGPRKLNQMGNWFGPTHCRVEPMWGSVDENDYYCSKENELVTFGKKPDPGFRGDLDETKECIMKGDITVDQIAVENPHMFHMYGRTMERIEDIAMRQRYRTEMTKGIWYTGPSGSNKSRTCFEGFDPDTHYVKSLDEADLKWWDGYKGQETVIFDEFRGQISFPYMLRLMDRYPLSVSRRGREPVPFMAKRLLISSIRHPRDVYVRQEGEPWEQFDRRCDVVELGAPDRGPWAKVIRGAQEVILDS